MWHMHQPDYRDSSGIMQMPWVFLHAIKDYYDMPWMLARHEGIKATFNITPPLIEQMKLYYSEPQKYDLFLNLWAQEPSSLSEKNRAWMVKLCKSTQFKTMVEPLPSYALLYKQDRYNDNELFDLQVLFILSWCGVYLRRNNEVIASLIKKERYYTSDDKHALLKELSAFISTIFDYYSQLQTEGRISISTTPLNHPILPLLMDMNNAVAANASTHIPHQHVPLLDDALLQVELAKDIFLDTFGFTPVGFWPAEGAVDEKSVALLKSCGVKWIATDEAILFKSLETSVRSDLYFPYDYNGIRLGFRDHSLSDLIGFTYRFWDPSMAVDHFISALFPIHKANPESTAFVILDGENAWEFFENNAFDFFDALYTKLSKTPWCHTVHMDDVSKLSAKPLSKLAPGSWIHGEFNTWVGHREKTRGWELIYITKLDFEHHKESLDEDIKSNITKHFLAAECSDWFWWYGDDHYTEFGVEFDILFRSHLIAIYDLMRVAPPYDLFNAIIENKSSQVFWLRPQSHITPVINGVHDSFFEWIGCGVVDETKIFSTMDRVRGPIHKILYGQDATNVYFSFSSDMNKLRDCDDMRIIIDPLGFNEHVALHPLKDSPLKDIFGKIEVEIVASSRLEIRIAKSAIKENNVQFRFELSKGDTVVQTLPGFGELEIQLDTDYSENWFV